MTQSTPLIPNASTHRRIVPSSKESWISSSITIRSNPRKPRAKLGILATPNALGYFVASNFFSNSWVMIFTGTPMFDVPSSNQAKFCIACAATQISSRGYSSSSASLICLPPCTRNCRCSVFPTPFRSAQRRLKSWWWKLSTQFFYTFTGPFSCFSTPGTVPLGLLSQESLVLLLQNVVVGTLPRS